MLLPQLYSPLLNYCNMDLVYTGDDLPLHNFAVFIPIFPVSISEKGRKAKFALVPCSKQVIQSGSSKLTLLCKLHHLYSVYVLVGYRNISHSNK